MSEGYRIIGQPRGEPRALGDVGVRVRVQLSGYPSRRWSRDLGAQLTQELVGHPGAAHLRVNVNELVQGDEILLDGVEDRDMSALADSLGRAVEAANRADTDKVRCVPNVTQREADTVASHIPLGDSRHAEPQVLVTIGLAPGAVGRCQEPSAIEPPAISSRSARWIVLIAAHHSSETWRATPIMDGASRIERGTPLADYRGPWPAAARASRGSAVTPNLHVGNRAWLGEQEPRTQSGCVVLRTDRGL